MILSHVLTRVRDTLFLQRQGQQPGPAYGIGETYRFIRDRSGPAVATPERTMTHWAPEPFRIARGFAPKMSYYAGLTAISHAQTAGNAYLPPPWIPKLRGASPPQRPGGGASRAVIPGVFIPRSLGR